MLNFTDALVSGSPLLNLRSLGMVHSMSVGVLNKQSVARAGLSSFLPGRTLISRWYTARTSVVSVSRVAAAGSVVVIDCVTTTVKGRGVPVGVGVGLAPPPKVQPAISPTPRSPAIQRRGRERFTQTD